jgi:hypothetical protein
MRCPNVKRAVWVLVEQCRQEVMIDAAAVGDLVLPAVPDDADRASGDGRGVGIVESSGSGAVAQVGGPAQRWCTNE